MFRCYLYYTCTRMFMCRRLGCPHWSTTGGPTTSDNGHQWQWSPYQTIPTIYSMQWSPHQTIPTICSMQWSPYQTIPTICSIQCIVRIAMVTIAHFNSPPWGFPGSLGCMALCMCVDSIREYEGLHNVWVGHVVMLGAERGKGG